MDTIIINKQEELEKYYNGLSHRYIVNGNLELNCSLRTWHGLCVLGDIKAAGDIETGCGIEAGGDIKAKYDIKATGDIIAGGDIIVGQRIEAGYSIKAMGDIIAKGWCFSHIFEVKCKKLITKLPLFHRQYYLNQKPMRKYKDVILNTCNCYDTIREALQPDAEKICAWKSWPELVKAHLMLFFGLTDWYVMKK
jgi:hypothetical protein